MLYLHHMTGIDAEIFARLPESVRNAYRDAHIADVECVECCALLVEECPWAASVRYDGARIIHGWHVALAFWY